jgi:hypothetical protein
MILKGWQSGLELPTARMTMTPVSPVVEGLEQFEIVFGKNQPEYMPLPALVGSLPNTNVISRWKLTDEERTAIAAGADIYTSQMTFGSLFQPLVVFVGTEKQDAATFMEHFSIGDLIPRDNINNALDKLLG